MKTFESKFRQPSKYDLVKLNKDNYVDKDFQGAWGIIKNDEEPYILDFIGKFEYLNNKKTEWTISQIEIMV